MDIFALALKITESGSALAMEALLAIEAQGKKSESSLTKMSGAVKGLWAAFTAGAAVGLLWKVVDAAGEAEKTVVQLQGAVENAGERFADWSPAMEEAVAHLQDVTRFGDEAGRTALANMITLTNDVTGSFKNFGLVADIAAKQQMSLAEASTLVSKVMNGQFMALQRMGIHVSSVAEGMKVLNERFGGFAEKDGKTFFGQLERIRNAFGEVMEEIGKTILGTSGLGDGMNGLVLILRNVQAWIVRHKTEIQNVTFATVAVTKAIGYLVGWAFKGLWGSLKIGETIVITFVGGVMEIPQAFRFAFGVALESTGKFVKLAGKLLDLAFGTHFADSVQANMIDAGRRMREEAGATFAAIDAQGIDAIKALWDANDQAAAAVGAAASGHPSRNRNGVGGGPPVVSTARAVMQDTTSFNVNAFELLKKRNAEGKVINPDKPLELKVAAKADLKLSNWGETVFGLMTDIEAQFETLSFSLADVIIGSFQEAFTGGLKSAGKFILKGLGDVLVTMGSTMIKTGAALIGLLPALSNPFTSGPAMLAAGVLMVGLGAALSAAATSKGGRGSASRVGGATAPTPASADEITRVTLGNTSAMGGGAVAPRPYIGNITFVGVNDPVAQRQFRQLVLNGERRNLP